MQNALDQLFTGGAKERRPVDLAARNRIDLKILTLESKLKITPNSQAQIGLKEEIAQLQRRRALLNVGGDGKR